MADAYGIAALAATRLVREGGLQPPAAWRRAVAQSGLSLTSQDKPCPRGTFLGLCEGGLISDVQGAPPGTYTRSHKNREYALRAVDILRRAPARTLPDAADLWRDVLKGD